MNHQIISLFIDDELTLNEKIEFVEEVHGSRPFKDEAIELLQQEKLLRSDPVEFIPERKLKASRPHILRFLRPVFSCRHCCRGDPDLRLFSLHASTNPGDALSFCCLSPGRQPG